MTKLSLKARSEVISDALNGPQFLEPLSVYSKLIVADGSANVPKDFGLGVELDETKLSEVATEKFSIP